MILSGPPQEFVPYGRRLLPFHPRHHYAATMTRGESDFISVEAAPSRDLFRAFNAVNLKDQTSVRKTQNHEQALNKYNLSRLRSGF